MNIIVANIDIRQDSAGRYNLNDLHRAAGGESRHQPGKWLDLQATQELVALLEDNVKITGIPVIVKKQGLGTYVCLDLVYDYATWISPAFKVEVFRTFHSVKTGAQAKQLPIDTPFKLGKSAFQFYRAIGLDRNAAAIAANQAVVKKLDTNLLELGGQTHLLSQTQRHYYNPTDLGKELGGVSAIDVNSALRQVGLQFNVGGKWTPTVSGAKFGRIFDVGKSHTDGTPITQLKWSIDVLELIRDHVRVLADDFLKEGVL